MRTSLKNIIRTIQPEFISDETNLQYQIPNQVCLYLKNRDYLIDLSLQDDVLKANVEVNGKQYDLDESDLKFIYEHLNNLLDYQIELTKQYFEAEMYLLEANEYFNYL